MGCFPAVKQTDPRENGSRVGLTTGGMETGFLSAAACRDLRVWTQFLCTHAEIGDLQGFSVEDASRKCPEALEQAELVGFRRGELRARGRGGRSRLLVWDIGELEQLRGGRLLGGSLRKQLGQP